MVCLYETIWNEYQIRFKRKKNNTVKRFFAVLFKKIHCKIYSGEFHDLTIVENGENSQMV